jgi:hypothetical protein
VPALDRWLFPSPLPRAGPVGTSPRPARAGDSEVIARAVAASQEVGDGYMIALRLARVLGFSPAWPGRPESGPSKPYAFLTLSRL